MINLKKGGRINLDKSLTRVRLELGWRPNSFDGPKHDLDLSMFICAPDAAGQSKLISDEHFVFYNNELCPEKAVEYSGDSRDGAKSSDGPDEKLLVNLAAVHPKATELSAVVTIHDGEKHGLNFGQISDSVIRLYNDENNELLAEYVLESGFQYETALQFGSLYKKDGGWQFKAVGQGYKRGLAEFIHAYGGDC